MEKAILDKIKNTGSKLLSTRMYQAGFKNGPGFNANVAQLLKKRKKGAVLLADLEKAFDRVDRAVLRKILRRRCEGDNDLMLIGLLSELLDGAWVEVGTHKIDTRLGVP